MTITLPLDRLIDFVIAQPWSAVTLVFLLGVVLPAVWSPRRRPAAMAVLYALLNTLTAIATTRRGRPPIG